MSTTRATRPDRPSGTRRSNAPLTRNRIIEIPTVKSLVAHADVQSKQDTFRFARGHLSHLPGTEQDDECAKGLQVKLDKAQIEDKNWPASQRSRNNLPKLGQSLNIIESQQSAEMMKAPRKFSEDTPITAAQIREAMMHPTDYPSLKGLTHEETKRHFDKQKLQRNKKLQMKMPNLSQNFESQEPGQYLAFTNQAMNRIADQNQVFGQVIRQVHRTYNDYINQLHKGEAIVNQKYTPSATPDLSDKPTVVCSEQDQNLDFLAKRSHELELEALSEVQKIAEINKEIAIEKNRVRDEKEHFDKYKFLHHDEPIYKARSVLPADMEDLTKAERINADLHEVVSLVSEYKTLEDDIRARNDDKKSILKADYEKTKLEYDELELSVSNHAEHLAELEEHYESLQKSCLFFINTLDNETLAQQYKDIINS